MSYQELQKNVLMPNLCAGCGVCSVVCTENIISFDMDKVIPIFNLSPDECLSGCSACYNVCPGKDPETPNHEIAIFGRKRAISERWLGISTHVFAGKSKDPDVFDKSASGGSTTSLIAVSMKYMKADYALVMGRDKDEPWRAAPVLVSDPEKLQEYSQSAYQLTPFLSKLREVYDTDPESRIVMSGIACHIQAIRKLQAHNSDIGHWAKTNIVFMVEIGCSSNTLPKGTYSLIKENTDIPIKEVSDLKYRDGEYPGQITVRSNNEGVSSVPFWHAVRHFKENKTFRCLACADWLSGLADVSVTDGDPNIFDASLGLSDIKKHSRIFVRTKKGLEVVRYAVSVDELAIWETELDGLNLGLERKRNRRATYEKKYKTLPEAPIRNYKDTSEIIDDDRFLALPEEFEKKSFK